MGVALTILEETTWKGQKGRRPLGYCSLPVFWAQRWRWHSWRVKLSPVSTVQMTAPDRRPGGRLRVWLSRVLRTKRTVSHGEPETGPWRLQHSC